MRLFSQRKGIKPVKSVIQVDSMDTELRNGLWNALTIFYWNRVKGQRISDYKNIDIFTLLKILWLNYFKKPIDTLRDYWPDTYKEIREYFPQSVSFEGPFPA